MAEDHGAPEAEHFSRAGPEIVETQRVSGAKSL